MLKTCEMCSNEFITESDPYVVNPRPSGVKYYCSCMIKEGNETLFETNRKLQAENERLQNYVISGIDKKFGGEE